MMQVGKEAGLLPKSWGRRAGRAHTPAWHQQGALEATQAHVAREAGSRRWAASGVHQALGQGLPDAAPFTPSQPFRAIISFSRDELPTRGGEPGW